MRLRCCHVAGQGGPLAPVQGAPKTALHVKGDMACNDSQSCCVAALSVHSFRCPVVNEVTSSC